jgi:hypothetical protein
VQGKNTSKICLPETQCDKMPNVRNFCFQESNYNICELMDYVEKMRHN